MLNDSDKDKLREHWRKALQDPFLAKEPWPDEDLECFHLSQVFSKYLNDPQNAEEAFARVEENLKVNLALEYHQYAYDDVEGYISATEKHFSELLRPTGRVYIPTIKANEEDFSEFFKAYGKGVHPN